MARRKDHTRKELKEMAIIAGLNIIDNQGFSGFSARKLATDIGYTVGTLYNVFDNYDNLILHINARTLDEWFDQMQKTLETEKNITILSLANFYIEYSRNNYNRWVTLFEYHISGDKKHPKWYQDRIIRFFDFVETLLMPIVKNNRKKARRSARILWAGIHGICILSFSGKLDIAEAESPEILAESFVKCYLAGLGNE